MITINTKSREFNKVEEYLLTIAPSMKTVKDIPDGTSLSVNGVLEFTDTKDNGESAEVLSFITDDNEVYACQSATFKRSLKDIMKIMDGGKFSIIKTSGKTKAGRDFINCELDVSKITV